MNEREREREKEESEIALGGMIDVGGECRLTASVVNGPETIRVNTPFHGLVLSPFTNKTVSREDRVGCRACLRGGELGAEASTRDADRSLW